MQKLNVKAMSLALGAAIGIYMLIIGLTAPFGWGGGMIEPISSLYIGFGPGFLGGVIGAIWGFVDGAIGGAIIALVYNFVAGKSNVNK